MTHRRVGAALLPAAVLLALAAGCEDNKPSATQKHTRETINKKTQKVLKLDDALAQGGQLAETTIAVDDPLSQSSSAYRTQVARIGAMAVEQAIQIRNAQNIMQDPKPLTYEEFMAEIIKPNQPDGIQLAMLPYYQEYAWDEKGQKLVAVEFPARKKEFQEAQDKELGRR